MLDEPLRDDPTWSARHIMRNADAFPIWVDLRREIDERRDAIVRRVRIHRDWLGDRNALLRELPADRIVDAARRTRAHDQRIGAELDGSLIELNALITRYNLHVPPALQLVRVTRESL